jgi:hypothetical protein
VLDQVRAWAEEDLRSVNQQIEYLLRRALAEDGRWPKPEIEAERGEDESVKGGSGSGRRS